MRYAYIFFCLCVPLGTAAAQVNLSSQAIITPARKPKLNSKLHSRSLTLENLEQIAFNNNPTLVAALTRIEAAQGRKIQAGLPPNPIVGYHATEIGNQGTAGQQGGFISQRFMTGGKLKLDQAIAQTKVNEAGYRLQSQAG